MASHIREKIPTEAALSRLDSIKVSVENFSHIQLWFVRSSGLSIETIHPYVTMLTQNGWYQSILARNKSGVDGNAQLLLKYQPTPGSNQAPKTVLEDELHDLVRCSIFCSTDKVDENKKSLMKSFESILVAHNAPLIRDHCRYLQSGARDT